MSVDEVFLKEYFLFGNIRSIQDPFTLETGIYFNKIDDVFIIHKWRSHWKAAWNGCSRLANRDRLNIVRLARFFMKNSGKLAKIVSFNLFPEESFNTISNAFQIHVCVCLRLRFLQKCSSLVKLQTVGLLKMPIMLLEMSSFTKNINIISSLTMQMVFQGIRYL